MIMERIKNFTDMVNVLVTQKQKKTLQKVAVDLGTTKSEVTRRLFAQLENKDFIKKYCVI
jgi:predicted nuclease of restriction endonuclease-like RecB superfamily